MLRNLAAEKGDPGNIFKDLRKHPQISAHQYLNINFLTDELFPQNLILKWISKSNLLRGIESTDTKNEGRNTLIKYAIKNIKND